MGYVLLELYSNAGVYQMYQMKQKIIIIVIIYMHTTRGVKRVQGHIILELISTSVPVRHSGPGSSCNWCPDNMFDLSMTPGASWSSHGRNWSILSLHGVLNE